MKKKKGKLDPRYEVIKLLFDYGQIASFEQIFNWVPKTVVAEDLEIGLMAMNSILSNPKRIVLEKLYQIGRLCRLTEEEICGLFYAYYLMKKGRGG